MVEHGKGVGLQCKGPAVVRVGRKPLQTIAGNLAQQGFRSGQIGIERKSLPGLQLALRQRPREFLETVDNRLRSTGNSLGTQRARKVRVTCHRTRQEIGGEPAVFH